VAPSDPASVAQAFRDYSAVELFLYRAEQVHPEFELGPHDLMHVAHICGVVQGMPLAILLAASWVEMLTPEEIVTEIRQSLSFLETDLRDVPLRQRSIRATFDYSWRLLDEGEQKVFLGLSVFRSSFTREAVLEVVGASLRDLKSLLSKSLLLHISPGRYALHELLRQYAAERLERAPDRGEAVRDRHCAFHSSELERWACELKGARQRETAAKMNLGIEDARAAWHWAVVHGQVTRLAKAVDGLWLYHEWRTRYEEAEATLRGGIKGLETVDSRDAQRLRAKCLILWSHSQFVFARKQPSIEAAERGLHLLQDLETAGQDVLHEMALALLHNARIKQYYSNDPLEAKRLLARSVALYEEVGDRWGLARALAYMGWMAEQVGQLGEARALCQKSPIIRRELGDQREMADAKLYLGIISWVQGHLDEALRLIEESLVIFRAGDDWIRIGQCTKGLGDALVRCGRYDDGLVLFESSIDIFEELAYASGASAVLPFLAEAKLHLGHYSEARTGAIRGIARARQANFHWGVGFSHFVTGLAALGEGACHEALSLFQESAAAFEEVRHRENRGWVSGPLGMAALATGETALARQCIPEALEIGTAIGAFMPVIYGLPAAALLLAGLVGRTAAKERPLAQQQPLPQSHLAPVGWAPGDESLGDAAGAFLDRRLTATIQCAPSNLPLPVRSPVWGGSRWHN
jgi:tetratricopeptide (TPR) repeat protein